MKTKLISSKTFNDYVNYYTIIKLKKQYILAYGHFFGDENMFVYLRIENNSSIKKSEMNNDYFKTDVSNILKNKYYEYYLFSTYTEAKMVFDEIKKGSN